MSSSGGPVLSFREDQSEEDLIALIGRVARGDRAALAALYQASNRELFGLALRILGDRAAAEEVLLDVYVQIWRTAQTYSQERGPPVTWMTLMTRSRAIDRLRSRATRQMVDVQPIDSLASYADSAPGPEESSEMAKRRRVIIAALAKLTPEQRQVIELAFFSGLSQSEIAAKLRKPLGTVKTQIRLGFVRLRDLLMNEASA
jgi:RNA polymerase sigma-70 factor (ECF subfamily)